MLRKGGDWEDCLPQATRSINSRVISHLAMAPCEILMGLPPSPDLSGLTKPFLPPSVVQAHVTALDDTAEHSRLVSKYTSYRSELHDQVSQLSIARKEQEASRYDRGIKHRDVFAAGDLIMLYQKNTGRLRPRWRGPFTINGFGSERMLSYTLRQLNGRLIKGTFMVITSSGSPLGQGICKSLQTRNCCSVRIFGKGATGKRSKNMITMHMIYGRSVLLACLYIYLLASLRICLKVAGAPARSKSQG
jgi:hypothetical protein